MLIKVNNILIKKKKKTSNDSNFDFRGISSFIKVLCMLVMYHLSFNSV